MWYRWKDGGNRMGYVNTRITLKNTDDVKQAKKGLITEPEIRQATVNVMVDTGAATLIINKELFQKLGLDVADERVVTLANNTKEICKLTDPVEIHWKDRFISMQALVVDNAPDVLLGVLPLEGLDLMVDTVNQKLVGVHGDEPIYYAM
jgi:clan AA aspartic protease